MAGIGNSENGGLGIPSTLSIPANFSYEEIWALYSRAPRSKIARFLHKICTFSIWAIKFVGLPL